ncbi:transposase [Nocardia sp. NBC_01329]|nr:transposase [Nocardia sp. NBC_01329]
MPDPSDERGDLLDHRRLRLAVEQIRRAGRRIDDDVLAHNSPAHSENINFFGAIEVDIDAELAQLGPTGYRPPRVRDALF